MDLKTNYKINSSSSRVYIPGLYRRHQFQLFSIWHIAAIQLFIFPCGAPIPNAELQHRFVFRIIWKVDIAFKTLGFMACYKIPNELLIKQNCHKPLRIINHGRRLHEDMPIHTFIPSGVTQQFLFRRQAKKAVSINCSICVHYIIRTYGVSVCFADKLSSNLVSKSKARWKPVAACEKYSNNLFIGFKRCGRESYKD